MRSIPGGGKPTELTKGGAPPHFSWIFSRDPRAASLLQGCTVVTAEGEKIGNVKDIMGDRHTHQLRYVMLSCKGSNASVVIPWHALYFDSALAQLVFYTYA